MSIQQITPIQPGWLRVTVHYDSAAKPTFTVATTCTEAPDERFITTTAYLDQKKHRAYLDLKVDYSLLEVESFDPCIMTNLRVGMWQAGSEVAFGLSTELTRTEYDFAHLNAHLVRRTWGEIEDTELSLTPGSRRYAAYPPFTIAIRSPKGQVGVAEVEELPARGTLGLRWLKVFPSLASFVVQWEVGGGAELDHAFGIDIHGRGITKPTVGLEHSNPGHATFGTGRWEPSFMTDPLQQVLPAPPRYPESLYHLQVLDNRGLPRELTPDDAIDVSYDATAHKLFALHGSAIKLLEHPAIGSASAIPVTVPRALLNAALMPGANAQPEALMNVLAAQLAQYGQTDAVTLPTQRGTQRNYLAPSVAAPLSAGSAPHEVVQQMQRPQSPQELSIVAGQPVFPPIDPLPNDPNDPNLKKQRSVSAATLDLSRPVPDLGPDGPGRCVLNADSTALTAPLTECDGYSHSSGCPTLPDPMPLNELAEFPGSRKQVSVLSSMTPLRAGQVNVMGTCGTHADNQAFEGALNLAFADAGPARLVLVDGLPVGIPEPRIALSNMGNLSHLYSWLGTQADVTEYPWATPWPSNSEYLTMPQFPEGLWPAREGRMLEWAAHVADFMPLAKDPALSLFRCMHGFWIGGFCTGQGTDPPGVYRSYSRMALDIAADPFRDGIFSLANSYNPFQRRDISLEDRDQAVFDVIHELRRGLPVRLDYSTKIMERDDVSPAPIPIELMRGHVTWYLPPELATCDFANYKLTYGHAVTIVGAVIRGPTDAPHPFKSFFVLQNNWGKNRGVQGFHAINFAAFKRLAFGLYTFHIDRDCSSWACR